MPHSQQKIYRTSSPAKTPLTALSISLLIPEAPVTMLFLSFSPNKSVEEQLTLLLRFFL
jgi:hypothetical protein